MKKISILILFAFAFLGFVAAPKIISKYENLTLRFRLAEEKLQSLGRLIARPIEVYQAQRGDADIIVSGNSIDELGFWEKLDTPWDEREFLKTKALSTYQNNIVVGLLGQAPGTAAVYSYDGSSWKTLGLASEVQGWESLRYVQVLQEFGGDLYAGIDNQVWKYSENANNWERVGGHGSSNPWGNDATYSLVVHKNNLYLGLMGDRPRMFKFENDHWEEVSGGLPNSGASGIYETWSHTDGRLYSALASINGSTSVYVYDDYEQVWDKIGGDGLNGSWISSGFSYGISFSSLNDWLILTSTRHPMTRGNFSSVWAYNGDEWFPVGASIAPIEWANTYSFNASVVIDDVLYVGSGGHPAGFVSVWQFNQDAWTLIGGRGVNGSWGEHYPHTLTGDLRNTAAEYPYRMIEWNGQMAIGFGDALGASQVYIYHPYQARTD